MDIYRAAKRRGKYLTLTTDTEVNRWGRNRIGRREKWPKKGWEEGEIGGKVGRREKLAQKVGRREIYLSVPPPPSE